MGADLLLTYLTHDEGKKLNWAGGRRAAQRLDREVVMDALADLGVDTPETLGEARKRVNEIISDLKTELSAPFARDAYKWHLRGAVIHVRGGTSWGEDPSEGWTRFVAAQHFPEVLVAIGLED